MNFFSKLLVLSVFLVSTSSFLTACVTTRAQLNEERGITDANSSSEAPSRTSQKTSAVQSEDLNESEPSESARSATVTNPPTTAGAAVSGATVSTASANSSPQAGGYGAEELRAEIARLNGRVEELEHEKKLQTDDRDAQQKKLQDQVVGLEKQLKETEPVVVAAPEGKSTFEAGKDAYFGGLFDQSIQFMDQYLQKNENLKEADQKEVAEAIYIRAESYFKQKQYKRAIVDFSKFPERFQKSPYHPKALLRIAESFAAMGMKEDSKVFYSEIVDKFPKTAEGKLAKKRLLKK
jgi:TolA-binding protein